MISGEGPRSESAPVEGFDSRVIGANGYDEAAGSGIFIVTAGIARKPGMSRDDLLNTNAKIVRDVCENIKPASLPTRSSSWSATRST
jgi:malate dehydrogenase